LSEREIGSGKWKKLRITILDRDGWQCAVCNKPAHTVDHIIPRVKGGVEFCVTRTQPCPAVPAACVLL